MEAIKKEYTSQERKPIIDEGLRDLLPALDDEARKALVADILQNGCYSPMICMKDMTLVDGHHRHAICEEHDIPYRMVLLPFEDKLAAKQWALDTQKARRNLTTWELGQIALKLKPEIEARARAKQAEYHGNQHDSGLFQKSEKVHPEAKINTTKQLAEVANVSHDTMNKIIQIDENAPEPIKDAIESMDISINKGYDITKKLRDVPEEERDAAALALLEEAYKKDNAEVDRTGNIAKHFNKMLEMISSAEISKENCWHWIEWGNMRRPELESLLIEIEEAMKKLEQLQEVIAQISLGDWRNPYDTKTLPEEGITKTDNEWDSAQSGDGDTGDIPEGEPDQQLDGGGNPEEA